MISVKLFVLVALVGVALAYQPGQYIPKSFYIIDHFGKKSDLVYVRNRRDIMEPLLRIRRGGGSSGAYSSASSHASASAGSSAGGSTGGSGGGNLPYYGVDYIPNVAQGLSQIQGQVQDLLNNIASNAGGGTGAHSFAGSTSSTNAGNGASGPSSGSSYGGLGSGHDAGYNGPVLFSRFGEAEGSGVHVSGEAAGPNAAFSQSSSSVDSQGKIKYSVQSGKY
ncbi:putative lysozyme-like protein isoform X1 [Sitophilus oryzae]|uniref:Lysozyme-like protein isoform X1 n=1 Tax=Sitophilus oryzae TaxID=7048 RepID=A0A6J2XJ32_SITOR|nr:putative lysozyme-like protein isoform X1 [Sitophilus oryzae]